MILPYNGKREIRYNGRAVGTVNGWASIAEVLKPGEKVVLLQDSKLNRTGRDALQAYSFENETEYNELNIRMTDSNYYAVGYWII